MRTKSAVRRIEIIEAQIKEALKKDRRDYSQEGNDKGCKGA